MCHALSFLVCYRKRVPAFICKTCGVQYPDTESPPTVCRICDDERQYVNPQGQQWTTMAELAAEGRENRIRNADPGVDSIHTTPRFGI